MNVAPIAFPAVEPGGENPIWKNGKFMLAGQELGVLQYGTNLAGWNDSLTAFHEEHAGDEHFIDCASREHAISQLQYITCNHPVVLEIGCSSGYLLPELKKKKPDAFLMGADIVSLSALHNRLPNIPLMQFDLLNCPLPDNSIDAVILLNVLEHIEDDMAAIKQIKRILKPGGIAIIEVPAGPHLYDIYDKELLHFRRYSLKDLTSKISSAELKIIKKSHLGFFLYPGFVLVKKRNQGLEGLDHTRQQEVIQKNIKQTSDNKLLKMIMKFELRLGQFINYPFGIRCLMTCKK